MTGVLFMYSYHHLVSQYPDDMIKKKKTARKQYFQAPQIFRDMNPCATLSSIRCE